MQIALKAYNGLYVCAEGGGNDEGLVHANREIIGAWETFTVHQLGLNTTGNLLVALETEEGRFWCAEQFGGQELRANRLGIGPWETFAVIGDITGTFGLRSSDGAHFVCAELGTTNIPVNVTRPRLGLWETFTATVLSGGPALAVLTGDESGLLYVDRLVIRDEHDQAWLYKGMTDFCLFQMDLEDQDIDPILDERIEVGARVLRVLGMMEYITHFRPQDYGRAVYLRGLDLFLDKLAARGLRCEFVVFADAQVIMPNVTEQRAHYKAVVEVLDRHWNAIGELANEFEKNGVNPANFDRPHTRTLWSAGSGLGDGAPYMPPWDLVMHHDTRKDEWPRSAKVSQDLAHGWDGFAGTKCPVIEDEPMGADEADKPGSRSNKPDDFFWYAAVAALCGAGATFHSTDGVYSRLLPPVQKACAVAFFAGLNSVPADAQTWGYTRGPLSDCPLSHTDDLALRTFAKLGPGVSAAVVVRPTDNWRAVSQAGWKIKAQSGPSGSRVDLTR